ncbi:unnamed protein product, partial [Vitis vinifera]
MLRTCLFVDPFSASKIVAFCALHDSGSLPYARLVFNQIPNPTTFTCNSIIRGYTNKNLPRQAILFYQLMMLQGLDPDRFTFPSLFKSCGVLCEGKQLHCHSTKLGFASDAYIQNTLMNMYSNCGCLVSARKVFDKMVNKSVVSWATMIGAYAQWDLPHEAIKLFRRMEIASNLFCWNIMINGHVEDSDYEEALSLFNEMQLSGVKGDKVTMASLLIACTHLGALELGKWLHVYIEKEKIEVDVALGTALVDMYAKCGSIESAMRVFQEMPEKDVMTWTALIVGLAMCGQGLKALELFHEMQMSEVKPDAITFVGVLAACSHAGLVNEGIAYFNSMPNKYGIQPSIEHYGCMVDMLGRAGRIAEAEDLIQNMPMAPDYFVLVGLLSACRIHGNLVVAERAAQQLIELDPKNGGTYVLLSNIYSSMKNWEAAKKMRELMVERNIKKPPGCSAIEVGGVVHEFVKGDVSHPQSSEIYETLDDMMRRLKSAGYVPDKSEVLFDMDEKEKENELSLHSEKLAIAFGLLSTTPGTPIRVVKNLRVCSDCHSAMKFISEVYNREIIVRDRNRFHHFTKGSCSCRDFW